MSGVDSSTLNGIFKPGSTVTIAKNCASEGVITVKACWKDAATIKTAPKAINPTYSGIAQKLVTNGEAENGTMNYAIGDSDTTAPTSGWATDVPEATLAGTYYVWYKAEGTGEYLDSEAKCCPAEIGKAPLTVTAKEKTITYGDAPANDGVAYEGFVNGETETVLAGSLTYDYNYQQNDPAGEYTITPGGLTAANYKMTYVPGILTVAPKPEPPVHVHTPETIPGKAATCTEAGLTDGEKCKTCGEILKKQEEIPALGHDWNEGKVTREATTLAAGSKEYTCKRCGATKEEEIPKILIPLGQSGWVGNSDGTWSYGDDSGNAVIGPMIDRGNLYVFSEKGKMITGWEKVGDHWYCAQATGEAYHDLWKEIKGNWYHFNSAGEMAAGWQLINGSWLYFGDNGALRTGWQKIKGNWYLFASHGELVIGWYKDKDGSWYYLDTDGKMLTGWQMIDGSWYYFGNTGAMATGWKQLNGKWFYFASYGQMVTGWYKDKGGIFYWFDENGIMATGWKEIDGRREMFDSAGKWLYTWDGK